MSRSDGLHRLVGWSVVSSLNHFFFHLSCSFHKMLEVRRSSKDFFDAQAMDNKMEVVSEPQAPKLSAKLEKSGKEQLGSKLRIVASKDTVPDDKKSKPNISPVTKVTKKVSNPNNKPM